MQRFAKLITRWFRSFLRSPAKGTILKSWKNERGQLFSILRTTPGALASYRLVFNAEDRDLLILCDDLRILRRNSRQLASPSEPLAVFLFSEEYKNSTHSISFLWAGRILNSKGKFRYQSIGIWAASLNHHFDYSDRLPSVFAEKLAIKIFNFNIDGFDFHESLESFNWEGAIEITAVEVFGSYHNILLKHIR